MKLTSVERIGRSQLIPGVRQTIPVEGEQGMWARIRNWFSRDAPPELPEEPDAEPPAGREEFLRFLQQHGVLVLATDIGPGRIDLVVHEYPTGEKVNPLFSGHAAARH